jgi:2',3'-cyclic-nucleotide 2'-phosphodiesterase (5'-nucleotidase family)
VDDAIGYAGLAALKAEMASDGSYVTLVDCGDAIQGAPIGTLSKGSYIIDMMNQLGYDVAVPGNHEFDYGMERFLELAGKANFPYV